MRVITLPFSILFVVFFGFSCARETKPLPIASPLDSYRDCLSIFPDRPWKTVHRIEAKLGVQGFSSYIGLTKGDPTKRNLQCALLTPEGFVLFEAEKIGEHLSIIQAIPPFDSSQFAKGLIEDVEFIFFAPQERPSKFGRAANGSFVCRWAGPFGNMKEILRMKSDLWKISHWNKQMNVKREAWLTKMPTDVFASQIELYVSGAHEYRLKMFLVK